MNVCETLDFVDQSVEQEEVTLPIAYILHDHMTREASCEVCKSALHAASQSRKSSSRGFHALAEVPLGAKVHPGRCHGCLIFFLSSFSFFFPFF